MQDLIKNVYKLKRNMNLRINYFLSNLKMLPFFNFNHSNSNNNRKKKLNQFSKILQNKSNLCSLNKIKMI